MLLLLLLSSSLSLSSVKEASGHYFIQSSKRNSGRNRSSPSKGLFNERQLLNQILSFKLHSGFIVIGCRKFKRVNQGHYRGTKWWLSLTLCHSLLRYLWPRPRLTACLAECNDHYHAQPPFPPPIVYLSYSLTFLYHFHSISFLPFSFFYKLNYIYSPLSPLSFFYPISYIQVTFLILLPFLAPFISLHVCLRCWRQFSHRFILLPSNLRSNLILLSSSPTFSSFRVLQSFLWILYLHSSEVEKVIWNGICTFWNWSSVSLHTISELRYRTKSNLTYCIIIICLCNFASSAFRSSRFSASRQDGVLNIFHMFNKIALSTWWLWTDFDTIRYSESV